ncbi:MAG: DUF4412 domain-containing protein [Chthoniobacteraceae bacterium]
MKSLFSLCAAFAALCLSLHADTVIVQKVEGSPMMNGDMTIKIKDNQMRTDMGTMMSSIMNLDTGDTITLMHTQKMVVKMSGEQMKANMSRAAAAAASASPGPKPEFVATGKTDDINGHQASEYTLTLMGMTIHYWFAKDYPNSASYTDALKKMMSSTLSKMAQGTSLMPENLPGRRARAHGDGSDGRQDYDHAGFHRGSAR